MRWFSRADQAPADRSLLGEHAKRLIDDPVLHLAFEALERDLTASWRNTKADQQTLRDDAYRMIRALDGVQAKLFAMLGDKQMIEAQHKAEEARKERERLRAA